MQNPNTALAFAKKIDTVYFLMDQSLHISDCSDVLSKHIPQLASGKHKLFTLFSVERPCVLKDYPSAKASVGNMILLSTHTKKFAIRGQFIALDGSEQLLFIGAPWVAWINAQGHESLLHISDFKASDSQLDLLVLTSTQKENLNDLEELTGELKAARKKEILARKSQASFFANMSHEMRTPLNTVVSALSLLNEERLNTHDAEMVDIAKASAENLAQVIDHILDYSKLEANGFTLFTDDFSIKRLLQTTSKIIALKAKLKSINFAVESESNTILQGDHRVIQQVLINLLSNAVKFSKAGTITLRACVDEASQTLTCEVEDNGSGVLPEHEKNLFKLYWSKSHLDQQLTTGTGLGLNISRQFVELMGGEIGFRNTGNGALFWFKIPIIIKKQDPHNNDVAELPHEQARHFSGRVLLAEDNFINQMLTQTLLSQRGIDVTTADNGLEAVEQCKHHHFDLILMDISMPIMNGIDAAKNILQLANKQDTPIIAFTAYASDEDKRSFKNTGMKGVLSKPIDIPTLERLCAKWLTINPKQPVIRHGVTPIPADLSNDDLMFNQNQAERLIKDVGTEVYLQVSAIFADEIEQKTAQLMAEYEQGHYEKLAKIAHSMHSTAASLGCKKWGETLKNIERAFHANDTDKIHTLVARLPLMKAKTQERLSQYCETLRVA